MAALKCIAAARSGFLLAALHSVAERVNPRKARPPAPHGPRVLASAGRPHCRCWEKSARLPRLSKNQSTESCDLFHPRGHSAMARQQRAELRIVAAEACGAVSGQTGTARVGWYACPRLTLFATEWSAARKNPMRAAALHLSAAISADVKARRILTSGRRKFPSGNFRSARDLEGAKRVSRGQAYRKTSHVPVCPKTARHASATATPQPRPRLLQQNEECPHLAQ